jgi:hypothetical protein
VAIVPESDVTMASSRRRIAKLPCDHLGLHGDVHCGCRASPSGRATCGSRPASPATSLQPLLALDDLAEGREAAAAVAHHADNRPGSGGRCVRGRYRSAHALGLAGRRQELEVWKELPTIRSVSHSPIARCEGAVPSTDAARCHRVVIGTQALPSRALMWARRGPRPPRSARPSRAGPPGLRVWRPCAPRACSAAASCTPTASGLVGAARGGRAVVVGLVALRRGTLLQRLGLRVRPGN